mmetsp:Transcript_2591/g.7190  ORF Transcript_2591/g.7190 Transcript_2591/m.7190 type:complete len:92 (+) Transcript_2591:119-394(+)
MRLLFPLLAVLVGTAAADTEDDVDGADAEKNEAMDFCNLCGCALRVSGSFSSRTVAWPSHRQHSSSSSSEIAVWSENEGGVYIIPVWGVPN